MDTQIFRYLAPAISHKFSGIGESDIPPWSVVQSHDSIDLEHWDEDVMGQPMPDEATMLQWIQEWEALSAYDKLSQSGKDAEDVRQSLLDRPLVQAMMTATPAEIDAEIDAADMQQLRNVIKVLILNERRLLRLARLLE